MHLATACNTECVCVVGLLNTERNVLEQFLEKSLTELTGSNEFTFLACEGAVVYSESHFNCRLAYLNERQRLGSICSADSIADSDAFDT